MSGGCKHDWSWIASSVSLLALHCSLTVKKYHYVETLAALGSLNTVTRCQRYNRSKELKQIFCYLQIDFNI